MRGALLIAAACLAALPLRAEEVAKPEAMPLDPHQTLDISLVSPDAALVEIVGYLEANDDLRLAYSMAPAAHLVAASAFRMGRFDQLMPTPPEGVRFGDLYKLYQGDAAVPGRNFGAGDLGREFSIFMSMARHLGGPPVDLRGAVAAGPPDISIGRHGLAEARIAVTGPHLTGPAIVHLEGAPTGRWRLLGAEMEAPEGRRVWLLID